MLHPQKYVYNSPWNDLCQQDIFHHRVHHDSLLFLEISHLLLFGPTHILVSQFQLVSNLEHSFLFESFCTFPELGHLLKRFRCWNISSIIKESFIIHWLHISLIQHIILFYIRHHWKRIQRSLNIQNNLTSIYKRAPPNFI